MKLTTNDYDFIKKIISLPKNKVNETDFPELKSSQFKYKISKINYILKLFKKDTFYKRNNNFFLKNKDVLLFLLENLEFRSFTKVQRKNSIISKLLTNRYININSLTQEFNQSRTSIKKDLELLKEDLRKFALSLEYKYSLGTFIKGTEEHVRLFFLNYFLNPDITLDYNNKKEEIDKIVFEFLKGKNSSFETAKILTTVLYIQYYRIKTKNPILNKEAESDQYLFSISEEQRSLLIDFFETNSIDEINYFLHYLKGLSYSEVDILFSNLYPEFEDIFYNFLGDLTLALEENLCEDEALFRQLKPHLQTTIFKLLNKISLGKKIINEDTERFASLTKIIQQKIKPMEKYFKVKFNASEILFVAFHIKASLIRLENKKYQKKNVLLVCNLGPGVAEILRGELNKNFVINIVDAISYFQFQIYDLTNIDFIIHTIPNFSSEIPSYKVEHFLTLKDIQALRKLGFFSK